MKRSILLLALVVLVSGAAHGDQPEKIVYYVQLIRGYDEDQPATPGAKAIGAKLSQSLHGVFRWEHYWEISRQEVVVPVGEKTKVALSSERAVEIDLCRPKKRKVTAISNNKIVSSTTQPVGKTMTIIGATRDLKSVWFVVVRRDKPPMD